MATFRLNGYTYDLYIHPRKKGKANRECLKWQTGLKCTWERISFNEYESARLTKTK